jgi:hypothetical protein
MSEEQLKEALELERRYSRHLEKMLNIWKKRYLSDHPEMNHKAVIFMVESEAKPAPQKSGGAGRSGKKSSKVRDWVFSQRGEFSATTAAEWFAANDPEVTRKDISFVLYSLAKNGKIELKQEGAPHSAAIYQNQH